MTYTVNFVNRLVKLGFKVIPEWRRYFNRNIKIRNNFRKSEVRNIISDTRSLINYLRDDTQIEIIRSTLTLDINSETINADQEFEVSFLRFEKSELARAGINKDVLKLMSNLIVKSRVALREEPLDSYNIEELTVRLDTLESRVDDLEVNLNTLETSEDPTISSELTRRIRQEAKNFICIACGISVLDIDSQLRSEMPETSITSSYLSFGILDLHNGTT